MGRLGDRHRRFCALRETAPRAFADEMEGLPPVVRYTQATPQIVRDLNDATAICSGDWICGAHESGVMSQALKQPRVKSEYEMRRVRGQMEVRHRFIVEPQQ